MNQISRIGVENQSDSMRNFPNLFQTRLICQSISKRNFEKKRVSKLDENQFEAVGKNIQMLQQLWD